MRHGIALFVLAILSFPGVAKCDLDRTVSVSGYGEVEVEPDMAIVEIGIYVFDRDLLKSKQEADAKIASILGVYGKLGIPSEDIRTTELNAKPKYRQHAEEWEFLGYEITRSVDVTVRQMRQLNVVLNKSLEAGANRLEAIRLTSSKAEELQDQALTQAINHAKRRAARLAEGFGASVGKVISIEDGRHGDGEIRYNLMFAPLFGEATYQPGRIKITAEVQVILGLTD
jgi:uncharacterized protein YggE